MSEQLTNEQIEIIQQQVMTTLDNIDPTKGRLIQLKQGPKNKLAVDSLMIGEPCYITDEEILVIGTGSGYIEVGKSEELEIADGSITQEKLSQSLVNLLIELNNSIVEVVDNLSSTSTTSALSASQGRILNEKINNLEIPEQVQVVDDLESTSTTEALSANQGRILDEKINTIVDNGTSVNVVDNLNSESSTEALSANQGRLLNNNKADKTLATTSTNGLMSSSDKSKLNGIDTEANKTVVTDNLTTTSTTNALSANQGKVLNDKIQNLIDNPVSTTINNTLTSTSTTEALSANQGKILNDNQNTHATKKASKSELGHVNAWEQGINIPTSAWQGTSAPYTASISLADIKSTDNPLITPIYNVDYTIALTQRNNYAKIDDATTSTGTITFRCFEEKPDIQLSLLVKVVGT